MGLTIHWELSADKGADPIKILESIRDRAKVLPFKEVGDQVLLFDGDSADVDKSPVDSPHRWAKIQASKYIRGIRGSMAPARFFHISLWPGEGCEQANFGLSQFEVGADYEWSSFCKTHYAVNEGLDHFLLCHLSVVAVLDHAKELGILKSVSDEGDYWETRSLEKLTRAIGKYNEQLAALAGALSDTFGRENVKAPIFERPDFEYLEHEGNKRLNIKREGGAQA